MVSLLLSLGYLQAVGTPQAASAPPPATSTIPKEGLAEKSSAQNDEEARRELDQLARDPEKARKSFDRLTHFLNHSHQQGSLQAIDAQAARVIGSLGEAGQSAIPAIKARWDSQARSPGFRIAAAPVLWKNEDFRRELVRGLILEFNPEICEISFLGTDLPRNHPVEIARILVSLTRDKDPGVREKACLYLGYGLSLRGPSKFGPRDFLAAAKKEAPRVTEALTLAFKDPVAKVKIAAVRSFLVWEPEKSHFIIPAVLAAVESGEFRFKKGFGKGSEPAALLNAVSDKSKVLDALLPLLESSQPAVQTEVTQILDKIGVEPQLLEIMNHGKSVVRRVASVTALSQSPKANQYLPDLFNALGDPVLEVRKAAAFGCLPFCWRQPQSAKMISVLREVLASSDVQGKLTTLQWIKRSEVLGTLLAPELDSLLGDKVAEIRILSALALVKSGSKVPNPTIAKVLAEGLEKGQYWDQVALLKALGKLGPEAREVLPAIKKCWESGNGRVRAQGYCTALLVDPDHLSEMALDRLAQLASKRGELRIDGNFLGDLLLELGPKAKPIHNRLLKEFGNSKIDDGKLALALVAIDPENAGQAKDWIRRQVEKNPDGDDAMDIARELPKIGPVARYLVPELKVMLHSRNAYLRQSAALTLGNLGDAGQECREDLKLLATRDADETVRKNAETALSKMKRK